MLNGAILPLLASVYGQGLSVLVILNLFELSEVLCYEWHCKWYGKMK